MRADLEIISDWIRPRSRILDLGCGDGTLLAHLRGQRECSGYGLEIDEDNVTRCVEAGLSVVQSDLDEGLAKFFPSATACFDYAVMTQTLQAIREPQKLIDEMLTIAREGIVTFPNMAYWKNRIQLGVMGRMPVTRSLPNHWYNTPNIHLCTVGDFERLCDDLDIEILQRTVVDAHHRTTVLGSAFPNVFGEVALYRLQRKQ